MRTAKLFDTTTGPGSYFGYGYFWWIDLEHPGRFYAMGEYGQYIYIAPDADAIVVASVAVRESTTPPGCHLPRRHRPTRALSALCAEAVAICAGT